jgi:hypothetical protein
MIPARDQETGQRQVNQSESATKERLGPESHLRPGVFLMIQSLETGGSERQFAALARSLDPRSFRLYLGCIRQRGPFLDGLGELPEFRLGGSLSGLQSLRSRLRLAQHLRRNDVAIAQAFRATGADASSDRQSAPAWRSA